MIFTGFGLLGLTCVADDRYRGYFGSLASFELNFPSASVSVMTSTPTALMATRDSGGTYRLDATAPGFGFGVGFALVDDYYEESLEREPVNEVFVDRSVYASDNVSRLDFDLGVVQQADADTLAIATAGAMILFYVRDEVVTRGVNV